MTSPQSYVSKEELQLFATIALRLVKDGYEQLELTTDNDLKIAVTFTPFQSVVARPKELQQKKDSL